MVDSEIISLCGPDARSFINDISASEKAVLLLLSRILQTTRLLEALRSVQVVQSILFNGRTAAI